MSQIIAFPAPIVSAIPPGISSGDMSAAEGASAFVAIALPALSAVAGPLEERLSALSHEAIDMVFAGIDAVIGSGAATVEERLLYELLHDEVGRRCMIRGIPTPWDLGEGDVPDGAA